MKNNDVKIPYLVEKTTLHDRVKGTNSNYIAWAKNIKIARSENKPTNIYDEIHVVVATDEDVELYGNE